MLWLEDKGEKMKVLYCDIVLDGHHKSYLKTLSDHQEKCITVIPQKEEGIRNQMIVHYKDYYTYTRRLLALMADTKCDSIHFVYGDCFLRQLFKQPKDFREKIIIMTLHHIEMSFFRKKVYQYWFKRITVGIVHTAYMKDQLNAIGIKNVVHIEYPKQSVVMTLSHSQIKKHLGLPDGVPILGCLGGTRSDKGLDILLDVLSKIASPFHLVIAGKEEDITKDMITKKIVSYHDQVTLDLSFLSDDLFNQYLNAVDFIVLPYRKVFNGASGPLTEGVWLRKTIIGPNHHSLGDIIIKNQLGYTFEAENHKSLEHVLEKALTEKWLWHEKAEKYRDTLNVEHFIEEHHKLYETLGK